MSRQARLISIIFVLVLALLVVLTICLAPEMAKASPSSPAASPTPSLVTAQTMAWANRWHHRAQRAHAALARIRECFDAHGPVAVANRPGRGASEETWERFGKRCRYQARDWRGKVKAGVAKMRHPGGSGAARWWPAARYCGWPSHLKSWFCAIVWRESSARILAVNASSGCFGLLQLHPCHWAGKGLAWIRDVFNQLRLGWRLYRQCGASPWALT